MYSFYYLILSCLFLLDSSTLCVLISSTWRIWSFIELNSTLSFLLSFSNASYCSLAYTWSNCFVFSWYRGFNFYRSRRFLLLSSRNLRRSSFYSSNFFCFSFIRWILSSFSFYWDSWNFLVYSSVLASWIRMALNLRSSRTLCLSIFSCLSFLKNITYSLFSYFGAVDVSYLSSSLTSIVCFSALLERLYSNYICVLFGSIMTEEWSYLLLGIGLFQLFSSSVFFEFFLIIRGGNLFGELLTLRGRILCLCFGFMLFFSWSSSLLSISAADTAELS